MQDIGGVRPRLRSRERRYARLQQRSLDIGLCETDLHTTPQLTARFWSTQKRSRRTPFAVRRTTDAACDMSVDLHDRGFCPCWNRSLANTSAGARHPTEGRPRKCGEGDVDRVDHRFSPTAVLLLSLKTDRQAGLRSDILVLRHISTFVASGI